MVKLGRHVLYCRYKKITRFFFLFKCQCQISKEIVFASEYLNCKNKGEFNNQLQYKILFASLFDIITKPPSLSILFFNPTLTPLLPHSPLQHSCHFNFPSHHYFHPHFSSTTFFTPLSLSQHSFHPTLTQPLFSPHSPSHHSSPHSPTSFSYSSKLIFSPQSLAPLLSLHYFAITF